MPRMKQEHDASVFDIISDAHKYLSDNCGWVDDTKYAGTFFPRFKDLIGLSLDDISMNSYCFEGFTLNLVRLYNRLLRDKVFHIASRLAKYIQSREFDPYFSVKFNVDPPAGDDNNSSYLMELVYNGGDIESLKFLFDHGADLNVRNGPGYTALMRAIEHCSYGRQKEHSYAGTDNIESIVFLLENGADINLPKQWGSSKLTWTGETPLIHAINRDRSLGLIKLLVLYGADINLQDKSTGISPLMMSCRHNRYDVVYYLLSLGVDPRLKDSDGHDAFFYAEPSDGFPGEMKNKQRISDLLLEYVNK